MYQVIMPVWITNQETLWLTEQAVESIREAGIADMIIIDNGSTYGVGRIKELADIYIRNEENLGYAKAVNQGLDICRDVVVIANNDILVSPNCLKVARNILENNKVGSVHFRMLPYDSGFVYGDQTWKDGKERWCTSSFFVVRNIQRYDENLLNSYDDYDFWYRMRQGGLTTAYTNIACYCHKDSHTQQQIQNRDENDTKNREYYKQKHGEYADEQFARMYPHQVLKPWRPMP